MKIKSFIIILFLLAPIAFSQNSTSITRYGFGDVEYNYSGRRAGMGDLGVALEDPDFIGTVNPASWNKIGSTRIEFGMSFSGMFLSEKSVSNYTGYGEFTGFTFGFPVSRKYGIGAAMGFIPVTNVSYKVMQPDMTDGNKVTLEGEGGLSKLFFGSSYTLPFDLSIGASFDYYFGNLNYSSTTKFVNTSFQNAVFQRSYKPKGLGFSAGLISPDFNKLFKLKDVDAIKLGFSMNYTGALRTDTILYRKSNYTEDTTGQAIVDVKIPLKIAGGLSIAWDKKFTVTLDYLTQPWQNYEFDNTKFDYLRALNKFSAGFEYRPIRESRSSFWNLIMYRAGVSYEQTQYNYNNNGINVLAFSAGLSLPVSFANTIDLGFTYGIKQSSDANFVKEKFIKLNLGISMGDIWFMTQDR